jgi:hypothetical protein
VPTHEPALGGRRAILKAILTDHLQMTPVAKRVIEESGKGRRHGRSADRRPTTRVWSRERVLIALLSLAPPDPAAALLDALDVDRAGVGAGLRKPSAAQRRATVDEAQGRQRRRGRVLGMNWRPVFDPGVVHRELAIIKGDPHCNAARDGGVAAHRPRVAFTSARYRGCGAVAGCVRARGSEPGAAPG